MFSIFQSYLIIFVQWFEQTITYHNKRIPKLSFLDKFENCFKIKFSKTAFIKALNNIFKVGKDEL